MSKTDPYRPSGAPRCSSGRSEDPIEQAACNVIRMLQEQYLEWATRCSGLRGDEIRDAQVGLGEAVATIVDSVRELRATMLG